MYEKIVFETPEEILDYEFPKLISLVLNYDYDRAYFIGENGQRFGVSNKITRESLIIAAFKKCGINLVIDDKRIQYTTAHEYEKNKIEING